MFSGEQMSNDNFSLLNDGQRSQKVGIEHKPDFFQGNETTNSCFPFIKGGLIGTDYDVIKLMMNWGHPPTQ